MRVLIVNPPHQSIGSRSPGEMLPPLGLLSIAGPLINDGHDVTLIDADPENWPLELIVRETMAHAPDVLLIGHNGSTSAHPTVATLLTKFRARMRDVIIIYGGVFPTYHWRDVLDECPEVDVIIRGEGEETTRQLLAALARAAPIDRIKGLAFRDDERRPVVTPAAPMIQNLDDYRVAWELIDHAKYSYYGGMRGVSIQFSRGCPHLCSYCGQRGFWTRWRHRDPQRFAREIGRLHREHGVRLFNLADENPTTSKKVWRQLLEAIIAENIDITMVATIRADDIVRDADFLHLYRKAGIERLLVGVEHTDEATLEKVRKGSTTGTDRRAIQLMREAGILSLVSWVVGFEEETERDYWRAYRKLLSYDPDQIITLYVTPHRWTPFFKETATRRVIQLDRRRWDYKHQVLANRNLPPWRTFLWVKLIEVLVQARPKALRRTYLHPDPKLRHGMRWYARIGRRVWLHEVWCFLTRDRATRTQAGPSLAQFWGAPQVDEQEALAVTRARGASTHLSTSVIPAKAGTQ